MQTLLFPTIALVAALAACSAQQPQAGPAGSAAAANPVTARESLLASSKPADGAVVTQALDTIELHFARPARLIEVTIAAADGTLTPMMVTAVGEAQHYSLPLSGLDKGSYTVRWRASSGGGDYQGDFGFEVR